MGRYPSWPLRVGAALIILSILMPGGVGARSPRDSAFRIPHSAFGIGELYLALGDSLGVGFTSSLFDTRGYVPQFRGLLEQKAGHPVQLKNLSVSGETTRSILAPGGQLAAALDAIKGAQGNGWRVSPITVDIGGNDLLALQDAGDAAREAGLADFRANLAQLFDRLVAATTRNGARAGDIVTMTIYNPYGGDPAVFHSQAWWVERFNAALGEEAARRDIAVAPVYERFRNNERALTWMPVDFHANNQGHRAIAEALWQVAGYDTAAPTLEIVEPAGEPLARAVATIKVRAGDDVGVARVDLLLDDKALPPPLYEPAFGLFIGYWDARAAPPGPHRLGVVAADAAGNTTRRDLTVVR